jgi:hypothetical protein
MELHFETIMRAAEQQLANEAHQLVKTDHKTAAKLVEIAIDKIVASYSTEQKLMILAGVRGISVLEVQADAFAHVRTMSETSTVMLKSCVKHRLEMVESAINIAVFGEGVLQAADAFLKVAETAEYSERWLSENTVIAMREAHDRLYAGEGTKDDLRTLLVGATLFDKIINTDRQSQLCVEHKLDSLSVGEVGKELKFYQNLLKPGWPLLDDAFDRLIEQQQRDVGITAEKKSALSPR